MIQRTMYVLAVQSLAASAEFYQGALGFSVREVGDPGWRFFERDDCTIMAGECVDALPASALGDHSYFAYFVVDDIDALYQRTVNYGAELIKPLRNEPWGMREFGLRTVDGHRIMVGQETGERSDHGDE